MTQIKVEERIEVSSAFDLDPATLDPAMHYRFCSPRNLNRRRAQGYELVSRSQSGVKFLNEDGRLPSAKPDDLLWVGDAVLMACRKNTFHQRRKMRNQMAQNNLKQEGVFTEKAKRRGVKERLIINESEGDEE